MKTITSADNSHFRRWLKLLDGRGVHAEGLALASGPKLVREIVRHRPETLDAVLVGPDHPAPESQIPGFRLAGPLFNRLDVLGTHSPLAVVRVPEPTAWDPAEPPRGLEVILALSDPSNLGACLRSAEAFGARRAVLAEECASPYLPRAIRASAGSSLRLPLARAGALAEIRSGPIVGLDLKGVNIAEWRWPVNTYLVVGQEGKGLPQGLCTSLVNIPMAADVESLNATVAASIAMFTYSLANRAT